MSLRFLALVYVVFSFCSLSHAFLQKSLTAKDCKAGRFAIQNPDGSLVGSFDYSEFEALRFTEYGPMQLYFQNSIPRHRQKKLILSLNGHFVASVPISMVAEWDDAQEKLVYPRHPNIARNLESLIIYAENFLAEQCPKRGYPTAGNALRKSLGTKTFTKGPL